MALEIVVLGSLNMDIVVQMARRPSTGETIMADDCFFSAGGKGANQAFAAAKLGADTTMIGLVGNDDFGQQLKKNLEKYQISTSSIETCLTKKTGIAFITVDNEGDNSIVVVPGANSKLSAEFVKKYYSIISKAKLLLVQLEIPLEAVMEAISIANANQVPVLLDPAPAQNLPDELLCNITYLTPNVTEISYLTGINVTDLESAKQAAKTLIRRGVKYVFAKLGGKGVVVVGSSEELYIPGYDVPVIDTTAAGDSFAGGLAMALVKGKELREATFFANAVAALSVTRRGAQSSMPNFTEVSHFLGSVYQIEHEEELS
jgi:ribokinase